MTVYWSQVQATACQMFLCIFFHNPRQLVSCLQLCLSMHLVQINEVQELKQDLGGSNAGIFHLHVW
jgi:hypothetical protein